MAADISTSYGQIVYCPPRSPKPMITPCFAPTRSNKRKMLQEFNQNEDKEQELSKNKIILYILCLSSQNKISVSCMKYHITTKLSHNNPGAPFFQIYTIQFYFNIFGLNKRGLIFQQSTHP